MRHLLALCVALLVTLCVSGGLSADTRTTGFAITWGVMFIVCEALGFLLWSETAS